VGARGRCKIASEAKQAGWGLKMRILGSRVYSSGKRWTLWRWTDVDPDGGDEIYLTRLHFFQTPWCSCMLHWIQRPDPQPDLHDHPNAFLSIILRGWYVEEVPKSGSDNERITRRVSLWNFKRATDQHRIIALGKETLTLVFAGPVVRGWGFHTPDGWLPWRQYVASHQPTSSSRES
jgi:hypothetical protein